MKIGERYLENFTVGQILRFRAARIDKERAKAFAAEFDPQPFHLDEEAARGSIFCGLAASGWYTAAVTMRLLVESELNPAGGIVGARGSTSSAGPVRCGPAMSCASRTKSLKCGRRNHGRSKNSSRYGRQR